MYKAMFKHFRNITTLVLFFCSQATFANKAPKLTVIFVIDQLAYHLIQKLNPQFKEGLKLLTKEGVRYTNAYFPHAMPATATGHTGLNTGTYAKDHGIIGNRWFDAQGNNVYCDDDTEQVSAVFSPEGTYSYGKSAKKIMVDGLSDQFVLASNTKKTDHAYGVSLKSRAAIATASKLGKALWFDEQAGQFTSSKAYFSQIPAWVTTFNQNKVTPIKTVTWNTVFPLTGPAYATHNRLTYRFSRNPHGLVGTKIVVKNSTQNPDDQYDTFMQTPHANQWVLELGKQCIEQHIDKNKPDRMLLWICLSSLDKVGHRYGPESLEVLDMMYHLDEQLGKFIQHAQKKVGKEKVLFALTADHGVSPIPELLRQKGYSNARRIPYKKLLSHMNRFIHQKYGIENLIQNFKNPQFYIDMHKFEILDKQKQNQILTALKKLLVQTPGIKQAWTYNELKKSYFEPSEIENYFKQQLYPGKSGQLIIQTFPYNLMSKHKKGTSHRTPYEHDTHVPLIIYQPGSFEKKVIKQKVWTLQLPNTLAQILKVQKPSASTFDTLPGMFGK